MGKAKKRMSKGKMAKRDKDNKKMQRWLQVVRIERDCHKQHGKEVTYGVGKR